MIDFTKFLIRGDGVWWGQAAAEPRPLVDALITQNARIGPIRTFTGLSWNDQLAVTMPDRVSMVSYGGLGELRELSRTGRLEVVPCHYSALPRMFAEHHLPCDVGLVQVSPPDRDGRCSLGVGVDYVADAVPHTPVLIAEINAQMPATIGSEKIPLDRFTATISTDRPLPEDPSRDPDDVDRRIADHIAELVDDGDTVQLGVGSLGSAVLDSLAGHTDLGFHTGMITDGLMRLVDAGVATGRRKELDAGLIVVGTALGSAELYKRVPELPVRFLPTSYTHSPQILSQLANHPPCHLACVEAMLEETPLTPPGADTPASAIACIAVVKAGPSSPSARLIKLDHPELGGTELHHLHLFTPTEPSLHAHSPRPPRRAPPTP